MGQGLAQVITFILILVGLTSVSEGWARLLSSRSLKAKLRGTLYAWLVAVGLGLGAVVTAYFNFEGRKVVGALLMPIGLFSMILWMVTVLDLRRGAWAKGFSHLALLVLFVGAGSSEIGHHLMKGLEEQIPEDPGGNFEAVMVLSGGTRLNRRDEPELGDAGDRLRLGAALIHCGRTDQLIVTAHSPTQNRDLSAESTSILRQLGVSTSSITSLYEPVNTETEIAAMVALSQERGWKRVGLVTSAWHLPRAMRLLERIAPERDFELVPLGANHLSIKERPPSVLWWLPTAGGFLLTHRWFWEILGTYLA